MRPEYLEAHLRRDPVTEQKLQLLWQFYVKDKQPLQAAEVLGALAETSEYVLLWLGQIRSLIATRFYLVSTFLWSLDWSISLLRLEMPSRILSPLVVTTRMHLLS